jgi:hypothetical protein
MADLTPTVQDRRMIPQAIRDAAEQRIRPSALAYLALCPGRALMEAGTRDEDAPKGSPECRLGTDAHALIAAELLRRHRTGG